MCGECEKKRDIQRHDKCEIMYYHKAGNSVSCELCKYFNGKKYCLCVRHLWFKN